MLNHLYKEYEIAKIIDGRLYFNSYDICKLKIQENFFIGENNIFVFGKLAVDIPERYIYSDPLNPFWSCRCTKSIDYGFSFYHHNKVIFECDFSEFLIFASGSRCFIDIFENNENLSLKQFIDYFPAQSTYQYITNYKKRIFATMGKEYEYA